MTDANKNDLEPSQLCGISISASATNHLQGKAALRYANKLSSLDIADPYQLPGELFSDVKVSATIPSVQFGDIYSYLIDFPSSYTGQSLKAYKSLSAYRYFESGWVSNTLLWQPKGKDFIIVTSKVKHSMKTSEPPLRPWIAVLPNGQVRTAHCNCMSGLGECCSHVAATLFALMAASDYRQSISCTSKPCSWSGVGATSIKTVEPKKGKDMLFRSPKRTKMCNSECEIPPMSAVEEAKMFTALAQTENIEERPAKAAILSIIPEHAERYRPRNCKLPLPLSQLYDPSARNMSSDDLDKHCDRVFNSMAVTLAESDLIEQATKKQAKSKIWMQQRSGRITASKFYAVCHTSIVKPSVSLVSQICDPEGHTFTTEATSWGLSEEKTAITQYCNTFLCSHDNYNITKSGFRVNTEYPYIGATPDGLISCSCCGEGIIEIKCPFNQKHMKVTDACKDAQFCLHMDESGHIRLKQNHPYYYQVQAQLLVTEASFCDFVVYTATGDEYGLFVERITRDDTFLSEIMQHIQQFYKCVILPNLIAKIITCPVLKPAFAKSNSVCYCHEPSTDNMLECKSGSCDIQFFHIDCLKLKRIPKSWKCPACRSKFKKIDSLN